MAPHNPERQIDLATHALRYFVAAAQELHFGRAAERLRITPPSLSGQIARLEGQVGARLFLRTSRRVELTPEGQELLELARAVLDAHDEIIAWSSGLTDRRRPPLRVGLIAAASLTTPILGAARERIPRVRLEIHQLGFTEGVDALLDCRVDVAFLPEPLPSLPSRLCKRRMWTEPRVLVVSAAHPLSGRTSVRVEETDDEVFITAEGPPEIIDWWVVDPRPDGTSPRRGPTARSLDEMLEMCAAGLGVNLSPASVGTYNNRPDLRFVPVENIPPAQVTLCRLREPRHPDVPAFERVALTVVGGR